MSQCNSEFDDKTKCDNRKFIDLLKKSSVDENEYNKICNQSLESYNLNLKNEAELFLFSKTESKIE